MAPANSLHLLPIGAPLHRRLPLDPRPDMGVHVVVPLLRRRPPPFPPPPPHTPRPPPRNTPIEWLLCFPLGTRPSGRVFFWSYIYYLSRFLHALRTFVTVFRHRRLSFFKLFNHSILIFISFLCLEYSQSFQVVAILLTTLVYGYRFWTAIGLPAACFPFVVSCQLALLGCNLVCHVGVLLLHYLKGGGCNGIGAWLLNAAILFLCLNLYLRMHLRKTKSSSSAADHLKSKNF